MEMSAAKRSLLNTYYHAMLPWRWASGKLRYARRQEPVQILFYHRVADDRMNPWTISRQAFAEQMDWLAERFDVASLSEAQRRITTGENGRPTAVITFDDGYAENMDYAMPLLAERQLPCMYFVSTNFVLSNRPFPHDVERGEPLEPNTPGDIRQLAEWGIEIGAHTRSHANLAEVAEDQLVDEIVGSKQDLEEMTDRPVKYFAFPYGQPQHLSSEGFQIAREAGFDGVCSAYGGYNFPGSDPFHLERFHADPEFIRIKHWLSVDPIKQLRCPSFDYQTGLDPELTISGEAT